MKDRVVLDTNIYISGLFWPGKPNRILRMGLQQEINPKTRLKIVEEDPDDNKFIEAAVDSKAKHIISGDKHLLKIKKHEKINIITPTQYLKK